MVTEETKVFSLTRGSMSLQNYIVAASPNPTYLPVGKPVVFHTSSIGILVCEPISLLAQLNQKTEKIDNEKALQQWLQVLIELANCQVPVTFLEPSVSLSDQTFIHDQAFILGKRALMGKMVNTIRKDEPAKLERFLRKKGYQIYHSPFFFESEVTLYENNPHAFCGYGIRTQKASLAILQRFLGDEYSVFGMELINPTFFHLDLAFSVLPKNNFIVYLPAFSAETQRRLQNWWTKEGISIQNQVYFLNEREALSLQANIVSLPDKKEYSTGHILSPPLSSKLEKWLHARGFHTIQLDLSEFHKAGGSIHCILNHL